MKRKGMLTGVLMALLAFWLGFGMVSTDNLYAADEVIKWRVQSHWPASSSSYRTV